MVALPVCDTLCEALDDLLIVRPTMSFVDLRRDPVGGFGAFLELFEVVVCLIARGDLDEVLGKLSARVEGYIEALILLRRTAGICKLAEWA